MICVITLSRRTIARNNPLHIPADLQHYARIAIARVPGESRLTARFTPMYIIVDFRAYADRGIFVLNEHTIVRYGRECILFQFYLAEISVD